MTKKEFGTANVMRRRRSKFTSRVHVDDVATAIIASMQSPSAGNIYNVVDDDPTPRAEAERYARKLLGLTMRHASPLSISKSSPSTMSDDIMNTRLEGPSKRVSNDKIKKDLNVNLRFHSYQDGLKAIHEGILSPFCVEK